jgi:hypothetical protein
MRLSKIKKIGGPAIVIKKQKSSLRLIRTDFDCQNKIRSHLSIQ